MKKQKYKSGHQQRRRRQVSERRSKNHGRTIHGRLLQSRITEAVNDKEIDVNSMPEPSCAKCGDERYILQGCCSGRDCSCYGQPVSMTNCSECNPLGDKGLGETVKPYADIVEYIGTGTQG